MTESGAQTEFRDLAFRALALDQRVHATIIGDLIRQAVVENGGDWTTSLAALKKALRKEP